MASEAWRNYFPQLRSDFNHRKNYVKSVPMPL